MTDFLDEKRREITDRLKELKPLVDEYGRLEAAASALAGVRGSAPAARHAAPRRRGPGRPRGSVEPHESGHGHSGPPRNRHANPVVPPDAAAPGRRKGSGTRAAEALSFVQGQPGITIPELAAKMGIKQNYLYRVLPGLEQEGKVSKKGRGWHPKG